MVERITSRRLTLCTLPALRGSNLPRPQAQRMCCGVHTESSADRSEMGQIDRSRRRRGCAGALRHKICTASLDNAPLIDGFVRRFSYTATRFRLLRWPLTTLLLPPATRHSPLFRADAVRSIRGEPRRSANRQAFPSSPYQAILHGLQDRQIERISFRCQRAHTAPALRPEQGAGLHLIPNWKRPSARSRHTQFTARLPDPCGRLRKVVSS